MTIRHFSRILCATLILAFPCQSALGGPQESPKSNLSTVNVDTTITAVTLYRDQALITEKATVALEPGLYELRFLELPETVQPQTIQTKAAGPVRILSVEYTKQQASIPATPQDTEAQTRIVQIQQELSKIDLDRSVLAAQEEFLTAIRVRATNDASENSGTDKLNLETIREQMAFIAEEKAKLLTAQRNLDENQRKLETELGKIQSNSSDSGSLMNVQHVALLSILCSEPGQATFELTYLVDHTMWEPVYNVRAIADGSHASVEYDALLTQRTGKDWHDVTLTLSTAEPTVTTRPPVLHPWFVDVQSPLFDEPANLDSQEETEIQTDSSVHASLDNVTLGEISGQVSELIPSDIPVTFQLSRPITVKSHQQKPQRIRIATIDSPSRFVHEAVPLLTDRVYVRSDLTNKSSYQLLPGQASIFIGQNYVNRAMLSSVLPNQKYRVYFGVDPAVTAKRELLSERTQSTGLLGGGRRTNRDYQITIENRLDKSLAVELWDRHAMSRSEEIRVDVRNLSEPLVADPQFVTDERPQGLMKWLVTIPSGAIGKDAYSVTYSVRIDRAKNIEITELPE